MRLLLLSLLLCLYLCLRSGSCCRSVGGGTLGFVGFHRVVDRVGGALQVGLRFLDVRESGLVFFQQFVCRIDG